MGSDHLPIEISLDAQPHRNIHTNPIRYEFNKTDREVFESTLEAALSSGDVPELKSTQDVNKYADFIVTAISTAVDKAGALSLAYLTSRSHSHFFLVQHSISCSRIFKLKFYFMKKCSCRESNSRLLIESTVSYPPGHQGNDAGKCNFLVIIF